MSRLRVGERERMAVAVAVHYWLCPCGRTDQTYLSPRGKKQHRHLPRPLSPLLFLLLLLHFNHTAAARLNKQIERRRRLLRPHALSLPLLLGRIRPPAASSAASLPRASLPLLLPLLFLLGPQLPEHEHEHGRVPVPLPLARRPRPQRRPAPRRCCDKGTRARARGARGDPRQLLRVPSPAAGSCCIARSTRQPRYKHSHRHRHRHGHARRTRSWSRSWSRDCTGRGKRESAALPLLLHGLQAGRRAGAGAG